MRGFAMRGLLSKILLLFLNPCNSKITKNHRLLVDNMKYVQARFGTSENLAY